MSVPSTASRRMAFYYGFLGPVFSPTIINTNGQENPLFVEKQRFPPVVRIRAGATDSPLLCFFDGEARTLDASDSYRQRINGVTGSTQTEGSVSSYAWSGGGAGSTKSYTFSAASPPSSPLSCTVTDSLGTQSTGFRFVNVVKRPDAASGPYPMDIIRIDGFTEELPSRGWGGARIRVTVPSAYASTLQQGQLFALYVEEYEDGVRTSAGEIFCGCIELPEVELRPQGATTGEAQNFVFTASTIERSLFGREGMDSDVHMFWDKALIEEAETTTDPMGGPVTRSSGVILASPWHIIDRLTLGKTIFHLMAYHCMIQANATVYRLPELVGIRCDFWNVYSSVLEAEVAALGVSQGPLFRQLEQLGTGTGMRAYCSRTSEVTVTVIHPLKRVADAVVASVVQVNLYGLTLMDGDSANAVRQVILVQAVGVLELATDAAAIYVYPSTANATGEEIRPSSQLGFIGSDVGGAKLAKALYDDARSRKMIEIHIAGATFGIFNKLSITVTGQALYPWTAKEFQVERVIHETSPEHQGGHRTRILAREILISP